MAPYFMHYHAPGLNFVPPDGASVPCASTLVIGHTIDTLFKNNFPPQRISFCIILSHIPSICVCSVPLYSALTPDPIAQPLSLFIMMLPSTTFVFLLLSYYTHLIACADDALHARGACSSSYTVCNPKGAATTDEPPIGTGISSLFVDVVDTLDSANLAKREAGRRRRVVETRASGGSLCCGHLASYDRFVVGTDPR